MNVTVDVVGEGTRDVALPSGATYADLARAVEYSPQEVSVLVDGRPVPDDREVDADEVRLLRLIRGG